jgi:hypothetical protein
MSFGMSLGISSGFGFDRIPCVYAGSESPNSAESSSKSSRMRKIRSDLRSDSWGGGTHEFGHKFFGTDGPEPCQFFKLRSPPASVVLRGRRRGHAVNPVLAPPSSPFHVFSPGCLHGKLQLPRSRVGQGDRTRSPG